MIWLMLVPAWCIALVALVALCRAAHLEDVARGFVDDVVLPLPMTALPVTALPVTALPAPVRGRPAVPAPRQEVLPLAR